MLEKGLLSSQALKPEVRVSLVSFWVGPALEYIEPCSKNASPAGARTQVEAVSILMKAKKDKEATADRESTQQEGLIVHAYVA